MARRSKSDPTGQSRNRKRGTATLTRRLGRAEVQVRALFRDIPRTRRTKVKIVNAETQVIYDYDISALELETLQNNVERLVNFQLIESQGEMPPTWYWKDNVEPSYRQGTLEEVNEFNQLIVAAGIAGIVVGGLPVATVPAEQVILSQPYRDGLSKTFTSNFTSIKGLSEITSTQVMQQIELGIQAGNTPTKIAAAISERFDVSKSSAKRIANTEINKAFNDAKMETTKSISRRTGLRSGVLHISALLPTTRAHHAARHGNAYTVEQQTEWWNSNSNRVNCHCSIATVLISRDGKVVDSETQEEIKLERSFFD